MWTDNIKFKFTSSNCQFSAPLSRSSQIRRDGETLINKTYIQASGISTPSGWGQKQRLLAALKMANLPLLCAQENKEKISTGGETPLSAN